MTKRTGFGVFLLVAVLLFHIMIFPGLVPAQAMGVAAHSRRLWEVPGWYLLAVQEQQPVELLASEAEYEFPSELGFHLEIISLAAVEAVELEYGLEKVSCENASVRIVPDLTESGEKPGHLCADWIWDFRRSGSLPPGTRIWWRWHVTTEGGGSWLSPISWVVFEDDRYDWQTSQQGQITVHWYEGDPDFGEEMLRAAVDAQARLTADPGANLEEPINLYFYATAEELQDALVFSQRWTGGVAFPDYHTILIAAGPHDRTWGTRTVAHELMHLVVHQLAFNCWSDLPRWLDEGLATWAEGGLEPEQQEALDEAIAENKLLSLRSLNSSFSAHASRANLSYAQSYSVVVFLIDEYGRGRVLDLLAVFREGASYDGALEQVYGFDTDDLEGLWRAVIGAGPRPTVAAMDGIPTAVPTLALWGDEPTMESSAYTVLPTPSLEPAIQPTIYTSTPPSSLEPTATGTPVPTVIGALPAVTLEAAIDRQPVATPLGGTIQELDRDNGIWYAIGGGVVLVVVLIAALVRVYALRR